MSSPRASGTVGATSKPSMVRPAFSRPARSAPSVVSSACSGAKKISRAPSAISPVCSRFFGPMAAMYSGIRSRTGWTVSFSGLPGPSGSGSVQCSPEWVSRSRDIALRTISTYSRVRASGLSNRTPYQPSDTCGPETPRPRRKRPFERVSRVAAVMAVMAGVRAGIWKMAEPTSIRSVWAATQARTVGASDP